MKLGNLLLNVLSESLGLRLDWLKEVDSAEALGLMRHYHPTCPQPKLTMGTSKHTDHDFLTVLLQDQIGGLQVLGDDGKWLDVPPVHSALLVTNIGDLLQASSRTCFLSEKKVLIVFHSSAF